MIDCICTFYYVNKTQYSWKEEFLFDKILLKLIEFMPKFNREDYKIDYIEIVYDGFSSIILSDMEDTDGNISILKTYLTFCDF